MRLPSALPALLATMRYASALALAAAYYGEGGNLTNEGLGAIGRRAANGQNGPVLSASVIATVLLGVVFLTLISLAERLLLRWHVSQRRSSSSASPSRRSPDDRGRRSPPVPSSTHACPNRRRCRARHHPRARRLR